MAFDHTCLKTKIKNISGMSLVCSFLPPHGLTLADEEEVEIDGNIFEAIRHMKRTGAGRLIDSLKEALDTGLLTIMSLPAPILEDSVTGESKYVILENGTLVVDDPCWESVSV